MDFTQLILTLDWSAVGKLAAEDAGGAGEGSMIPADRTVGMKRKDTVDLGSPPTTR
jgi:hypothetical protein